MKKIMFILLGCLAGFAPLRAQTDATTAWPYRYPDFQEGTLIMADGQEQAATLNVHLLKGDLHFIDKQGVVRMAQPGLYPSARIGQDLFRRVGDAMMQVTPGPDDDNFVAVLRTADLSALNETGGAYGVSSTTASTQRITSVDLPGFVNTSHMELMQHREGGRKLRIKSEYYLVIDGKPVKAARKEVGEAAGAERAAAFKQFLKTNKIDWRDEQSLLTLFSFFKP